LRRNKTSGSSNRHKVSKRKSSNSKTLILRWKIKLSKVSID